MNYPTPMDVAEAEDKEAMTDPFADELAKCSVLYTENLVAEREALIAELAKCTEKRERYALQVCLLLDAMREAGVHIDEKWCWCDPTVENHSEDDVLRDYDVARVTNQPSAATENPEAMYSPVAREGHAGASARQIDVAAGDQLVAGQPERCCLDYPRCDCNSPPEPDNAPTLQPCGHPWKAQHDFKCILCSSPG